MTFSGGKFSFGTVTCRCGSVTQTRSNVTRHCVATHLERKVLSGPPISRFPLPKHVRLRQAARIRALGSLTGGLVIGSGEGGYEYFPLGYVLLDCNLTGLVGCNDILGTLVRLLLSGYVLPPE